MNCRWNEIQMPYCGKNIKHHHHLPYIIWLTRYWTTEYFLFASEWKLPVTDNVHKSGYKRLVYMKNGDGNRKNCRHIQEQWMTAVIFILPVCRTSDQCWDRSLCKWEAGRRWTKYMHSDKSANGRGTKEHTTPSKQAMFIQEVNRLQRPLNPAMFQNEL